MYANRANLAAVDHLGRKLPDYTECPPAKSDKVVALFYYLWHGYHGTQGPYDITKILEADPNAMQNPDSPYWPPAEHTPMLHWGEPMFGYYLSQDEWVLRRHVQMFIDAGVDVLFFDVTNGFTYRKAYLKLFSILDEYRRKGFAAPKVAFYTAPAIRGCGTGNLMDLWEQLYEPRLYPELWFYWKGKPLIVCHFMRSLPDEVREFFTWRKPTWCAPTEPDTWAWEGNPQKVAVDSNGAPEEVAVNVCRCAVDPNYPNKGEYAGMGSAAFGVPVMGRSWHNGAKDTRPNASHYGFLFEEQAKFALESDAPVAFLCQWNEWLVPFLTEKTNTLYGMPQWIRLQDEFNEEYSRDLEPMKGGYKDAYYLQMASFIRRFKGLDPPAKANGMHTITGFSDFDEVEPVYREYTGDVTPRDFRAYDAVGRYKNYTGRNEFAELRVAADSENVFFLAECSQKITEPSDERWMNLYLKTGTLPAWEGYDYRVRFDGKMKLCRYDCGWKEICAVDYEVDSKKLRLTIPKKLLGLGEKFRLEFKWSDNMQEDDVMDFYQNGDAAPRGRMNWVYYFE